MWALFAEHSDEGVVGAFRLMSVCRASREGVKGRLRTLSGLVECGEATTRVRREVLNCTCISCPLCRHPFSDITPAVSFAAEQAGLAKASPPTRRTVSDVARSLRRAAAKIAADVAAALKPSCVKEVAVGEVAVDKVDGREDTKAARLQRMDRTAKSLALNGGRIFVQGLIHRANWRNGNGRVYPPRILQREAHVFYNEHIRMNRALGELECPNPASPTFRSLNLNNVSHQVLDYHWEGDRLMGLVEVLPIPAGSMLRDLYCAGYQLGLASRGWATLMEREGFIYVQPDFELITFDFSWTFRGLSVDFPSTGEYINPVQCKYEQLQAPIDINAAYKSFVQYKEMESTPTDEAAATAAATATAAAAAG